MAQLNSVDLKIREPKECTKLHDYLVIGGVTCPELGFHEPVLLLFHPGKGTITVRAQCGCAVVESMAPMLVRLSNMLAEGHGPTGTPGSLH